jgi:SAM-dependent methyltransferase
MKHGADRWHGFDAVADRYDEDERSNRALTHMRTRIDARLREAFTEGDRLLEIGSGTGTEAARLVERGARVALLDASPRLLARAVEKVGAVRPEGLVGSHLLPARCVGELVGIYGASSFDGAYSSLGPLNGEPSLGPIAEGLAALVRPGGAVVLSVLNRWCLTETLGFALRGRWREAARRWDGPVQASVYPGGPRDFTTWYHTRAEITRAFDRAFRIDHAEALPLIWPPTHLAPLVDRMPGLFTLIEPIEPRLARWPLLRDLGDHVLLCLRRRGAYAK